jgi:hypothetical protein
MNRSIVALLTGVTAGTGFETASVVLTRIRVFILGEALMFATAALVHVGALMRGYEHRRAAAAEAAIAAVLVAGLAFTWFRPGATRRIGVAVQAFALLGTMVGLFTIAIGVGPQTGADLVYHAALVIVLLSGIVASVRNRSTLAG